MFTLKKESCDRFHVQKIASEAVQEEAISLRWEIIDPKNCTIIKAYKNETHTHLNFSLLEILSSSLLLKVETHQI
jgi:hypothetical protein